MIDVLSQAEQGALGRWLSTRLGRSVHVADAERAKDGYSNDSVMIEAIDANGVTVGLVLRRTIDTEGLYPVQRGAVGATLEVQYRVMDAGSRHGLLMPPVLGYETDPSVLGEPFLVMNRVDGEVPNDQSLVGTPGVIHHGDATARAGLVESTIQAMVEVHRLDWRAAGLGWLDRLAGGEADAVAGESRMASQLRLWRSYATRHLGGRAHPVLMDALGWLDRNRFDDGEVSLVWGDARLANSICDDRLRCVALLDWEGAAILPAGVDVGYWLLGDRLVHEVRGAPRLLGMPSAAEQLASYERIAGQRISDLGYYEVFAAMRVVALMLATYPRLVARGTQVHRDGADVANPYTDLLADLLANRRS